MIFSIIGGDARQLWLASYLADRGHRVFMSGFDTVACDERAVCAPYREAAAAADCVILPFPAASERGGLNAPFSEKEIHMEKIFDSMKKGAFAVGGRVSEGVRLLAAQKGVDLTDYGAREELEVCNAIPTAEGAIQLFMEETPITVFGSRCLVTGFGRIGKVLARALSAMGARVAVSARKVSDIAWIKASGYEALDSGKLAGRAGGFDAVFNTVPALLLTEEVLRETGEDCLIIDLASRPGGVDFEAAKKLGRKVIWALSLPGKVAPAAAGRIICDTVMNIVSERGAELI